MSSLLAHSSVIAWVCAASLAGCVTAEQVPSAARVDAPRSEMAVATTEAVPAMAQATGAQAIPSVEPAASRPATQPVDVGPKVTMPYTLDHFAREGPLAGVVAKVNLADPRVKVLVALADDRDPDGDGPAVGRLDTVEHVAMARDFALTVNASFFGVTGSQAILGKKVGYFVGNGAFPVGWHFSEGRLFGSPQKAGLRSALVVHRDGRVTIDADLDKLPADVASAVSGNKIVLHAGVPTTSPADEIRHPRTAVGVSADGRMLVLLVIDGRRVGYSRGANYAEVGALLKEFGAGEGLNLDGGGSTTLVVKDSVTGVFGVANRPSETSSLVPGFDSVQRPVVDVVGVGVADEAK